MATALIRTLHWPNLGLVVVLTRIAAVGAAVIDVYAEALNQMHEAQRRYPFTVW